MIAHRATQSRQTLRVKRHGIDHESDEGPCLFRVPRPVSSPTDVGPNGADEDAKPQGCDGRIEEQLRKTGELGVDLGHLRSLAVCR